jgi:predicted MFS family arabinose efflux permease
VSPTTFAPLKNPIFRSLWIANQVSNLGALMQAVTVGWLMATISHSDLMVTLVQASAALPVFILSFFAGAIADGFNRRRVMLASLVLMTTASAGLTALVAAGSISPWLILGFTFLIESGTALRNPAWIASVDDIVGRNDLAAAVTLNSVGYNIGRSVGPALGGILIASFGPLVTFALNSLGYLVPLGTIWRRKWQTRFSPLPHGSMATAIYDGLRFTALSSEIKAAISRGFLFGVASIAMLALLPVIVRDRLGGGSVVYGILMAGFGIGAFAGGLSAGFLRRMMSQEHLVRLASLSCAACAIALALRCPIAIEAAALAFGGAGWVLAWSSLGVCVQFASPRWVVGRTMSIYYALTYGGITVGSWLSGTISERYSPTSALALSAGALLLVAALGLLVPIREHRESEILPSEGFEAPAVAFDLKPRSGPIAIRIEYLIAQENIEAFLDLMRKRRHSSRRLGARNWALLRNLQEPSRWTETFRTPTWADYLRLHHRRTSVDEQLEARILALHTGSPAPQMSLLIERPADPARTPESLTSFVSPH